MGSSKVNQSRKKKRKREFWLLCLGTEKESLHGDTRWMAKVGNSWKERRNLFNCQRAAGEGAGLEMPRGRLDDFSCGIPATQFPGPAEETGFAYAPPCPFLSLAHPSPADRAWWGETSAGSPAWRFRTPSGLEAHIMKTKSGRGSMEIRSPPSCLSVSTAVRAFVCYLV